MQNATIPSIIAVRLKNKSSQNDTKSNNTKMANARLFDIVLFARGLFLVRSTCLSKSLSKKSFIMHPALLAEILPKKRIKR